MERIFPNEFSDLLNKNGIALLNRTPENKDGHSRISVIPNIIKTKYLDRIQSILNNKMAPLLKDFDRPVDPDWKRKVKKNFSEKLSKSMKMKSVMMNGNNSSAYKAAGEIGLIDMMRSTSFKKMGEAIMNKSFGDPGGRQIICYEDRGYVSPHTDYFPEFPYLKKGYFDIHLMFSNKHVGHQSLVYEKDGFLNNVIDISSPSAIAVYHLPFWHYTTPLMPVNDIKGGARRWLILGSFHE